MATRKLRTAGVWAAMFTIVYLTLTPLPLFALQWDSLGLEDII